MKHFLPTFVFQPLNNINDWLSMRMQTQLRVLSFSLVTSSSDNPVAFATISHGVSVQFEDVNDSASLSLRDDFVGKLLENAIITLRVGICKSTLGCMSTKSKVIRLRRVSLGCKDDVSQTFTVGELSKHQDSKLIPTRKLFDVTVSIVFVCYSEEYILVDEV